MGEKFKFHFKLEKTTWFVVI